jgi:serine/threonine protein kinase
MVADDKDSDRTESTSSIGDAPDRPRIKKLGHFRIDATLGSGGMGTIYLAYDESMKRPVALKVLHSSLGISEHAQSRFVREAWIAGQLDHPNIIKIHSRGEEHNVNYLAMELAEGGSLYDLIKQTQEQVPSGSDVTETIDQAYINAVLEKFIELAAALEHIHSKGFIHRDIKPHNILLSGAEKKFKFTDFGIAHADDMTRMTRAGDFMGTIKYMSPELLAAHRAGVDKRTDIYSLGVTLYETLTLTLPFKADSEKKLIGEILAGHYIEAHKTNRRISRDLETVLMKATHHDPNRRYQTAQGFADDLQRIIDDRPIFARRQSAISRGVRHLRRNYKVASMILFSVIVVAGGFYWQDYRARTVNSGEMSIRKVWSDSMVRLGHLGGISPNSSHVSIRTFPFADLGILDLADKEVQDLTSNRAVWAVVDTMSEGRQETFTDSLMKFGGAHNGSIWSPDGSQLAYAWISWANVGDLRLVGRDGANVKVLTAGEEVSVKNIIPYDWSTDGKQILAGGETDENLVKLLSISAIDGSAKEMETGDLMPSSFSDIRHSFFSPDNSYVAYTSSEKDILLLSVDGKINQPLVEHSARDYALGWSPDGKWVCFASDRSGTMDVWVIGVNEGKRLGEPQKISRNVGEIIPLGITDEESLYFGLNAGLTDVYVAAIDPETGMLSDSPQKVSQQFEGTNDWPEWSPDGKHLLYRSDREVGYGQGAKSPLCLYSTETDEVREIRVQLKEFSGHRYSPDGRFAITYGVDNAGQFGLFQIDLESGLATLLVKSADGADMRQAAIHQPTWSPNGDRLYYIYPQDFDKPSRLIQYDLETGQEKELLREDSYPNCPALSPDGQWLAFQTLDTMRTLNILPVDGGPLRSIVTFPGGTDWAYSIDWMPDCKSILYVKGSPLTPRIRELWQVFIDGKSPRKIGDFEGMSRVSVHPDGRQVAFSALKRQTEIWVMENFLPKD